jgi:hypothetical protein
LYSTNAWLSSLSAETKASSEFQQSPECALYVLLTNYFPSVADVQFHEMATDGLRWHISATVLTNVSDAISIEKVGMTLIYTNGQYRPSEILDFSSPLAYALQLHPCRQGLFGDYFPQIITNGMAQVDLTNFGSNSLSIFIALGTNQYRTIDRVLEESPHFARLVQFAANNDVTNFSNQMFATNAYPDEPLVLSAVSNLMVAYQHPESIRLLGEIGSQEVIESFVMPLSGHFGDMPDVLFFVKTNSEWRIVPYPYPLASEASTSTNAVSLSQVALQTRNRFLVASYTRLAVVEALRSTRPFVGFSEAGSVVSDDCDRNVSIPVTLSWAPQSAFTSSVSVVGGTATEGVDYLLSSTNMVFSPSNLVNNVSASIVANCVTGGDKTVILQLSAPVDSCRVGDDHSHVITIQHYATPPSVSFRERQTDVSAAVGDVAIPVDMTWPAITNVWVRWEDTLGGSATSGVDYVALPTNEGERVLMFAPGVVTTNLTVSIVNNPSDEREIKTIVLKISSVDNATVGEVFLHGIVITPVSTNAQVCFESSSISVQDNFGAFNVSAFLSKPLPVDCGVDCLVSSDSTATSGTDYVLSTNKFVFLAGSTNAFVTVDVVGNRGKNIVKTLNMYFRNTFPSGQLFLGSTTNCNITIVGTH